MTTPLSSRLQEISLDRYDWTNAARNVKVTPRRFFYPKSTADLVEIILAAETLGLRVRAVGSGHSYSEAPKGRDFLLSMKHLADFQLTPTDKLKSAYSQVPLVTAGAGIIIKKLTRELDKEGLGLINMGVIDFQTLSGAILTGTHGTGIDKPPMNDLVRSLKMVSTGGKLLQIEPTNGITDPQKQIADGEIELIQDDDIFYSVVMGFGAMGIIYELTIEVVPQYYLQEDRLLRPWSEVRLALLKGEFLEEVKNNSFLSFRVNPYQVKGEHLCAVVRQNEVPKGTPGSGRGSHYKRAFLSKFGDFAFLIESTIRKIRSKPMKTGKKIQASLKYTRDELFVGKSHEVLYQGGDGVLRYGISSEFAFPADGTKIVEVLEAIFARAKENVELANLCQSAHIAVRFVAPSKAWLSSAYGQPTVYIDLPSLMGVPAVLEILESYQKMMMGLGGFPHWGKHNSQLYQNHAVIRNRFPERQKWVKVRDTLDPQGTFLNDFVCRLGLTDLP